jgi:hypothetical protein
LIALGLAVAGVFCLLLFTPAASGEFWPLLFTILSFTGLMVTSLGAVMVSKARRRWTPPV